jgi:hypothetical protein
MQDLFEQSSALLSATFGPQILQIAKALVVLVLGWAIALIVRLVVRGALKRTTIDNRLAKWALGDEKSEGFEVERWVAKLVYYVLLLFVLVAFFNTLNLTLVSEPLTALLNKVFSYIPQVVGALILLAAAWILATLLRRIVRGGLELAKLDERIGGGVGLEQDKQPALSKTLSDSVYWLVYLLFLPTILGTLQLQGLLQPVQALIDRILTFLPNILAAGVLLAAGWFIARIVQRIVTNLLAAVGVDRLGEKVGLAPALGTKRLSGLLGLIVYVFILIPVLISSLNALGLEAITGPASEMLGSVLDAFPAIFAAGLLLALAYVVGRLVSGLISTLLAGAGFNNVLARLGLARKGIEEGARTPAGVVGTLILVAIMLFASIEAAGLLGFESLSVLLSSFIAFAGQVILGLVIFGVGLFLANLAADTVRASSAPQSSLLALSARISIVVLAGAIALRQMGLANEIIELAFGLLLGSIAVAVALAFGLGGRDVAARQIEEWRSSFKRES